MSTATKFLLILAGASLLLYLASLSSNAGLSGFATEYRTEVRRMSGAIFVFAVVGAGVSVLL